MKIIEENQHRIFKELQKDLTNVIIEYSKISKCDIENYDLEDFLCLLMRDYFIYYTILPTNYGKWEISVYKNGLKIESKYYKYSSSNYTQFRFIALFLALNYILNGNNYTY